MWCVILHVVFATDIKKCWHVIFHPQSDSDILLFKALMCLHAPATLLLCIFFCRSQAICAISATRCVYITAGEQGEKLKLESKLTLHHCKAESLSAITWLFSNHQQMFIC